MEKSQVGGFLSNSRKICRHFAFLVYRKKINPIFCYPVLYCDVPIFATGEWATLLGDFCLLPYNMLDLPNFAVTQNEIEEKMSFVLGFVLV